MAKNQTKVPAGADDEAQSKAFIEKARDLRPMKSTRRRTS